MHRQGTPFLRVGVLPLFDKAAGIDKVQLRRQSRTNHDGLVPGHPKEPQVRRHRREQAVPPPRPQQGRRSRSYRRTCLQAHDRERHHRQVLQHPSRHPSTQERPLPMGSMSLPRTPEKRKPTDTPRSTPRATTSTPSTPVATPPPLPATLSFTSTTRRWTGSGGCGRCKTPTSG